MKGWNGRGKWSVGCEVGERDGEGYVVRDKGKVMVSVCGWLKVVCMGKYEKWKWKGVDWVKESEEMLLGLCIGEEGE